MNDSHRVYALFMQANPVPDPALLPLARDEAPLPFMEGSTIMDTRETIEARPAPERGGGWRPVAVVAAAFVVVLALVGGALLLFGGEGDPVAAADAEPIVTCDGETCSWDGPTTITPGTLEIEFINDSDRKITFAVWVMSGTRLDDQLADRPAGTDIAITPDDEAPDGSLVLYSDVAPGASMSPSADVIAGQTYLVDCLTTATTTSGDDYYDHLWRPAVIEVVEP